MSDRKNLILCSDRLPSRSGKYRIKNNSSCNNGNGEVYYSVEHGWDIPEMIKSFSMILGWYEHPTI